MASACVTLLPIFACLLPLLVTVASYLVAVFYKTDISWIPYPSDLMKEQPERGIYSASLGISALLTMTVFLLRFAQVHSFTSSACKKLNYVALIIGILMLIGQIIVAGFSLEENKIVHYSGAVLYFGCSTLYMILQAHISRKHKLHHTTCIIVFRIFFAILGSFPPIAYTVARLLAPKSEDRYYIPQGSEWLLALLCFLYIASFSWDFSKLSIDFKNIEVRERGQEDFMRQDIPLM